MVLNPRLSPWEIRLVSSIFWHLLDIPDCNIYKSSVITTTVSEIVILDCTCVQNNNIWNWFQSSCKANWCHHSQLVVLQNKYLIFSFLDQFLKWCTICCRFNVVAESHVIFTSALQKLCKSPQFPPTEPVFPPKPGFPSCPPPHWRSASWSGKTWSLFALHRTPNSASSHRCKLPCGEPCPLPVLKLSSPSSGGRSRSRRCKCHFLQG